MYYYTFKGTFSLNAMNNKVLPCRVYTRVQNLGVFVIKSIDYMKSLIEYL